MSGHSKWSQIKHQKGKTDRLKGQTFTKLGRAITIAVKESGGITDPDSNFRLRLAIEKARDANMPKVNIDRAVERGKGMGTEGQLENITYEGFGPGNLAIMIEAATDNRQRTNQILKSLLSSSGGHLASPGSVNYLFKTVGTITFDKTSEDEDYYTELALEAGGNDVAFADGKVIIYTDITLLTSVKNELEKRNITIEKAEITKVPVSSILLNDQDKNKAEELISALLEIDDILGVYTNFK